LCKKPSPDILATMSWNNGTSTILMAKEMVAAFDAASFKAQLA
jgi:hypothetical protein